MSTLIRTSEGGVRIVNYAWVNVSKPGCEMQTYNTDHTHNPPQWQEDLYPADGDPYNQAVAIVMADKAEAEASGLYKQYVINAEERKYGRKSLITGNSWEVQLDEDGNEMPNDCMEVPQDPRNAQLELSNVTVSIWYRQLGSVTKVSILTQGNLSQA